MTVQYTASDLQIMALYIAIFVHEIMSAKRTHEIRPVVLSSTQLLVYLLDTGIRYLPIFKSQKGSIKALNFPIVIS